ncbi:MAG: Hsp20/alpha crystallin family protein [Spirochaetota bacterium]|nr:Hsp20/alpha crystallin family protein [Spirochaetota bacterium]
MYTTNNLFNDLFKLKNVFDDNFYRLPEYASRNIEFPYINIAEDDKTLELSAIMPSVNPNDINIEIQNDVLTIEGERKSDIEDKPYIRRERDFGKFKKSIKLPYHVINEKVKAALKDGILRITLEKNEEAGPKKIKIQ